MAGIWVPLLLLFLSASPNFARHSRRRIREGPEHFFRGKLFHHHQQNVLGDSFENTVGNLANVSTLWFNQTLDHFTPADTRTWKQVLSIKNDHKRSVFLLEI